MELNLQQYVPDLCFSGLDRLYRENCEPVSTISRLSTSSAPLFPIPHTTDDITTSNGSSIGPLPIFFFIGLLVVIMVMICRKLLEMQDEKSDDLLEDALISDNHSIRLDAGGHGHHNRMSGEGGALYHPHDTAGYDAGYDYQAHRYPEGRNALTDYPNTTEDPYRYRNRNHPHHRHSSYNSDQSDSQSYSYSKHSSPGTHHLKRSLSNHLPYA